jgi:protein-tyrosine phosphatase
MSVLEVHTVTVCVDCQIAWPVDGEAGCTDADHSHRPWEVHRHVSEVQLPDGTCVTAVSFAAAAPYERETRPDFGLYLDERWEPPWPHKHLAWPDFGIPSDRAALRTSLTDLLARARAGEQVEIGCLGAHGRTGTALACLAILTGVEADHAVAWVRSNYCDQAVETDQQADFVCTFEPV